MFSFFNISPENMVWFYLAPLLVFGPIFIAVLWNFGLKNLFTPPPEFEEQQRHVREHLAHINKRRENKAGFHDRAQHSATRVSVHWVGQAALYAAFAAVLGLLSAWPSYRQSQSDIAQVKLSLSHPGQRVKACHKRTREELAKLAPNMRAKMKCSRERWPITVELSLDGDVIFLGTAAAAGLRSDGASSFYEKFNLPAGMYNLSVRLNDAGPQGAFSQKLSQDITLVPAQNLVIGFREDGSGFYLK